VGTPVVALQLLLLLLLLLRFISAAHCSLQELHRAQHEG
jgi:hypothetical protein